MNHGGRSARRAILGGHDHREATTRGDNAPTLLETSQGVRYGDVGLGQAGPHVHRGERGAPRCLKIIDEVGHSIHYKCVN